MAGVFDVLKTSASGAGAPTPEAAKLTKASPPVGICQGYQMVTGLACYTALEGKTETVGATSTVICKVCTSIEELSKSLDVDQSLSASYLGIASVNEKLKLIEQQKVTTNSISIVVYAKHNMGKETVTDVTLKPGIKIPKSTGEVKEFVTSYGDCFLSSRTKGGEYFGMYTFYSESREEQKQLSVKMEAEGVLSPVSINLSFQITLNNFLKSVKTRSSFRQIMSGIANPKFPTQDELIKFAVEFPSMELTSPVITNFETSGYEHVPGFSTCFCQVGKNRELLTGGRKNPDFIADMCRLQQLENDVSTVKETYEFYGIATFFDEDTKLKAAEVAVENDMKLVDKLLEGYIEDPTKPISSTPVLTSLIKKLTPSLDYVVARSQEFGTQKHFPNRPSTPFDDVGDAATFFNRRTKIKQIEILDMGNTILGVLRITYRSAKETWTASHGIVETAFYSLVDKLVLSSGEFVTTVNTTFFPSGPLVVAASFRTSFGREVGTKGGFEFQGKWKVPNNCFLLGFAGRCGNDRGVFRLQMIYGRFRPATWDTFERSILKS